AVVDEIKKKGIEPIVKSTICYATTQRQDAARALAGEVDAVVVIGGRNSSNTTRLAEICSASCPKTFHIESTDELDKSWFDGCLTIGVTAGASTPEEQISEVVLTLERM
ncbi:MAG: 4-hydroxy-3-methylbut-2-enyl diphosphate reductase, partial [Eggerthellaceae bacterium]|nr:4-hydroxy-3-methylbut-2-enyl diphosphate reductase [Eggerthellaceae bacterium]